MENNSIGDIAPRRITKKLQVRFDKTDQLIVTAIEDTEGATRAAGAPLLLKLVDGGLHRGSRAASTVELFRHLLILAG
jgi:hypothetical protein